MAVGVVDARLRFDLGVGLGDGVGEIFFRFGDAVGDGPGDGVGEVFFVLRF